MTAMLNGTFKVRSDEPRTAPYKLAMVGGTGKGREGAVFCASGDAFLICVARFVSLILKSIAISDISEVNPSDPDPALTEAVLLSFQEAAVEAWWAAARQKYNNAKSDGAAGKGYGNAYKLGQWLDAGRIPCTGGCGCAGCLKGWCDNGGEHPRGGLPQMSRPSAAGF